jgi:hypothetical protein
MVGDVFVVGVTLFFQCQILKNKDKITTRLVSAKRGGVASHFFTLFTKKYSETFF